MADKFIMKYSFLGILYFLIVCIRLILFLVYAPNSEPARPPFPWGILSLWPNRSFSPHHYGTSHSVWAMPCSFGEHHQPADGTVQAVGHSNENISRLIIFLFQVLFHHLRQGSITGLVSLNDLGRSLIDYNNMIILVNNCHITCSYRRQPG